MISWLIKFSFFLLSVVPVVTAANVEKINVEKFQEKYVLEKRNWEELQEEVEYLIENPVRGKQDDPLVIAYHKALAKARVLRGKSFGRLKSLENILALRKPVRDPLDELYKRLALLKQWNCERQYEKNAQLFPLPCSPSGESESQIGHRLAKGQGTPKSILETRLNNLRLVQENQNSNRPKKSRQSTSNDKVTDEELEELLNRIDNLKCDLSQMPKTLPTTNLQLSQARQRKLNIHARERRFKLDISLEILLLTMPLISNEDEEGDDIELPKAPQHLIPLSVEHEKQFKVKSRRRRAILNITQRIEQLRN